VRRALLRRSPLQHCSGPALAFLGDGLRVLALQLLEVRGELRRRKDRLPSRALELREVTDEALVLLGARENANPVVRARELALHSQAKFQGFAEFCDHRLDTCAGALHLRVPLVFQQLKCPQPLASEPHGLDARDTGRDVILRRVCAHALDLLLDAPEQFLELLCLTLLARLQARALLSHLIELLA